MEAVGLFTVYVLACSEGKFYVGRTSNLEAQPVDHFRGEGFAWIRRYPPLEVLETHEGCDAYDEHKYTKLWMAKKGIENVRGGSYNQLELEAETVAFLEKEIAMAQDSCIL